MPSNSIIIFGLGDFARVAAIYLEHDSPYNVSAFTANAEYISEASLMGKPVVPFEELVKQFPPSSYSMFVAIGFSRVNRLRAEVYNQCKAMGYQLISYINSKATYWGEIEIGDNCFIFEENVIQPFVTIGNNVILWSGNHIGHDSTIGDHCFISSHVVISGNVQVGPYCFLGVNATIRDGINVAPECVVGAGALIMKDTVEQGVYAVKGTPLFPKRSNELRGI